MRTFKIITNLLILMLVAVGIANAEEKQQEYHEAWPASGVSSLDLINKFGEVRITNDSGSDVTIDVVVTVEAANERKANELLNMINIKIYKSGTTIKAQTSIDNNFKSQRKFSIDYLVNIPSDKNLKIENKYGNTIVNRLEANGIFLIKYGNFTANELNTPDDGTLNLELKYGNGSIGEATHLSAEIGYSPLSIETLQSLHLESKYSSIEVAEGDQIQIESKYDKLLFEQVNTVTATTKYSNLKIRKLASRLTVESGYGGIQVEEVNADFESISISNSYGQISLGLDEASYDVDANCRYCGISYPEDHFNGDRVKENNMYQIKGKIGNAPGGKVTVKSQYGEIKLRN